MKLVKRKLKKYDIGGYLNTAMSLGSDIYSTTQADEYSKNNAKGSLIGGIIGGAAGTLLAPIAPGVSTALGYSLGSTLGGVVGSHYDNKNLELNNTKERADLVNQNANVNYQINKAPNSGGLGYFKKGGKIKGCGCGIKMKCGGKLHKMNMGGVVPEYEAEQGEVITGMDTQLEDGTQLASDVTRVDGNTHENGGTVGTGGDFVYSDSINLSPDIKTLLNKHIKNSKTYAEAAEKLGKQKGKYEGKAMSPNPLEAETGKAMLGKIDTFLQLLAQDQELVKEEFNMNMGTQLMKYGGKLRKLQNGGPPYIDIRNPNISSIGKPKPINLNIPTVTRTNDFNIQNYPVNTLSPEANAGLMYWRTPDKPNTVTPRNTRITPTQNNTSLVNPIIIPDRDIMNPNEFTGNTITGLGESDITYQPFGKENYDRTAYTTLESESPTSPENDNRSNIINNPYLQANLANLTNYAMNLGTINRIKNYERPSLLPVRQQRFYRDNRNVGAINNTFATMVREGINPTLLSQLYGSNIRSIGDANTQQNIIENSIRNSNVQAANVTDSANVQLINSYRNSLIDTYNKKVADRLNARNAATQGYMANTYAQRQDDAEIERMGMRMLADPTGATEAYTERINTSPFFTPYTKSRFRKLQSN